MTNIRESAAHRDKRARTGESSDDESNRSLGDQVNPDHVFVKRNDLSVGTIIKRAAVEIHETKYKHGYEVIVSEKNMMANGLSSLLVLINEKDGCQKNLFTEEQWESLINRYKKEYKFTRVEVHKEAENIWKIICYASQRAKGITLGSEYIRKIYSNDIYKSHLPTLKIYDHVDKSAYEHKLNIKFIVDHNNTEYEVDVGEATRNNIESEELIPEEGRLLRNGKDTLDKSAVFSIEDEHAWNFQIEGSGCFALTVHLDANGLYVAVPQFTFRLPSGLDSLSQFLESLSDLITMRDKLLRGPVGTLDVISKNAAIIDN